MAKKLDITPVQAKIIDDNFKKMDFNELVRVAFADDSLDGRSVEGRAIKMYIQEKHGKDASEALRTKTNYIKKEPYVLSKDEEKFLLDNYSKSAKPMELCSLLFKEPVTNLDRRYKSVIAFLNDNVDDLDDSFIPADARYNVPRSLERLVPKINEYLNVNFSVATLSPDLQRKMASLLKYMAVFRFAFTINQYQKDYQRKIFEESFIRYTWDKTDLTEEETDLYINLCDEIVNGTNIKKTIANMEVQLDEAFDSNDEDKKKVSMTYVELLNSMREKQDKSQQRVKQLVDTLNGSRSKRLQSRQAASATIIHLVDAWKDKDRRDKILELAKREHILEEKEVDRLDTLDEMKAFMVGLTKEEAMHG